MIMIEVKTQDGDKLFKGYSELCNYINRIENIKALYSENKPWSFVRRRYETLCFLHERNISLTLKEHEAIEKKRGLIEIVKGNREHITQILFSRYFDIEALKRDWCYEYCIEHGLQISEWFKPGSVMA